MKDAKQLKGSSQKVRRAHILLKADADGPNWTDRQLSEAFCCRTQTVENIRKQFVVNGFRQALDGKKRACSPIPKLLNGEQEAKITAARPGSPPQGVCGLDFASAGASGGRIGNCGVGQS